MEDEQVFDEYHSFLLSLYKEGLMQGFRIDHIDGLQNPGEYIKKLRKLFGDACYIIAEKILESKESMPVDWQLNGTSGYEFLAHVNQLFTDRQGARQLLEYYKTKVPGLPPYKQLVANNKKMMLENYMGGEWDNLVQYLVHLNLAGEFETERIKVALGAIMVALPVYRIYPDEIPLKGEALSVMIECFEKARHAEPAYIAELNHLFSLLITVVPEFASGNVLRFVLRLMQFTGPLTAKGVEDTTFYIYNPLISHDEVGDSPSKLGISINAFHKRMQIRSQTSPLSLNATATHDTKRGEDARLRLNRLSEFPDDWIERVKRWFDMNKRYAKGDGDSRIPHINDEYFLYQSIVGGFPEDLEASEEWISRLKEYFVKVLREAKARSSWEAPDEDYEKGCASFIDNVLHDDETFLPDAKVFMKRLTGVSMRYSLAQTLVKITSPGIPDVYQGCELWDLSYVDPDNRRPVDYESRINYLNEIITQEKQGPASLFSFLNSKRVSGVEKLFVTWKALNFRRHYSDLFIHGEYRPVKLSGKEQLACVYARTYQNTALLVAVGFASAHETPQDNLGEAEGESLVLLEDLPNNWTNIFTGKHILANGYIPVKELFTDFPVALLYSS
jgi:(1->4)-alpha-D-glucan 1-alpha-D-glucosylmutase